MNAIEKYIRERLGRADAPPEVEADDLWAGIESQLPATDKAPLAPRAFPWKTVVSGLLLLFVAGGIWMSYPATTTEAPLAKTRPVETMATTPAKEAAPPTIATTKTTYRELDDQLETPSNLPKETTKPGKPSSVKGQQPTTKTNRPGQPQDRVGKPFARQPKNENLPAPSAAESISPTNRPAARPTRTNASPPASDEYKIVYSEIAAEELPLKKPSIAPAAAPNPTAASSTENTLPKTEAIPAVAETDTDTDTDKPKVDAPAIENRPTATVAPAVEPAANPEDQAKKTEALLPDSDTDKEAKIDASEEEEPSFKGRNGSRISIGLQTGTNLLLRNYTTGGEGPGEALNTAVTAVAGASFGIDLNYRITNKLSVSTGLEYHRTLNPFDYATVTDTMIAHPSEFNSGLIDAVARRRTTHNHRLSFFTVPLLVNHTWTFGNFDLGLGAGVGLNFRQSATGKTLDANRLVVAYDAATGNVDVPGFFLSYRLRPVLSWQPKPDGKLRFEFSGGLNYQTFGVSPLSGVKQNALLLNGSVGLRYGF